MPLINGNPGLFKTRTKTPRKWFSKIYDKITLSTNCARTHSTVLLCRHSMPRLKNEKNANFNFWNEILGLSRQAQ